MFEIPSPPLTCPIFSPLVPASVPKTLTTSCLPESKPFPSHTGHHQPLPTALAQGKRPGLHLLCQQSVLRACHSHSQALDGAFTEENRAQCRAATAPLLEAVDNLSAFASNPEFSSIPAQISPEVRQCEERTSGSAASSSLQESRDSASLPPLSLGPGCHGAHCDLCQDNVGECRRTNPDRSSPSSQSPGPPALVSAGWPLPYCLGLHQEAHYKHEVWRG